MELATLLGDTAQGMKTKALPSLFLDRDGTLIEERDYLGDPKQVKLLPGVVRGLKRLKRAGYPVVVISNQSGVGRGLLSRVRVERVNRRGTSAVTKGCSLFSSTFRMIVLPRSFKSIPFTESGMVIAGSTPRATPIFATSM